MKALAWDATPGLHQPQVLPCSSDNGKRKVSKQAVHTPAERRKPGTGSLNRLFTETTLSSKLFPHMEDFKQDPGV